MMSKQFGDVDFLGAIVGCNLSIRRDGDRFFATLFDKHDQVIVQSLRHEDQDDAIKELIQRWRDWKSAARHMAWSLTPKVDSLAAIGA